jgi:carbonic anhydrase
MKALLEPESVAAMPTVTSWLRNAAAALPVAEALYESDLREGSDRSLLEELTEQNVLLQLRHLKTHPSVVEAMGAGDLTMSGWVYEIGSGEVRIARDGQQIFTPIGGAVGKVRRA